MPYPKIFTTLLVVLLIQSSLSNPVAEEDSFSEEEAEMRKNPTPEQKLLLYVYDNFLGLVKNYATDAAKISREMLKDESLVANHQPEVEEFKKNLTNFLNKYETDNVSAKTWNLVDIYSSTTNQYDDLAEDKHTADTRFITEILKKYDSRHAALEFVRKFQEIVKDFTKLYDENRSHLDKPILEWYDNFKTITDVEQQIESFDKFIDLL